MYFYEIFSHLSTNYGDDTDECQVKKKLKHVNLFWGNPTPYYTLLWNTWYLWQIGTQKAKTMKIGTIYSVGQYQRGVVIRGGAGRGN